MSGVGVAGVMLTSGPGPPCGAAAAVTAPWLAPVAAPERAACPATRAAAEAGAVEEVATAGSAGSCATSMWTSPPSAGGNGDGAPSVGGCDTDALLLLGDESPPTDGRRRPSKTRARGVEIVLRPDASMLRTLMRGRSRARAEPLKSWLACSEVAETSTPLASDGRRPDLLLSVRQPEVATLAILGATSSAMFCMPSAEVRQGEAKGRSGGGSGPRRRR
jgi:hypothetical protein